MGNRCLFHVYNTLLCTYNQLITMTFRVFKGFTIQGAAIQLILSLNVQAFSLMGSCFSVIFRQVTFLLLHSMFFDGEATKQIINLETNSTTFC